MKKERERLNTQTMYYSHNYVLLDRIQKLVALSSTPLFKEEYIKERTDVLIIYKEYILYSDVQEDIVANAICWAIRVLEDIFSGYRVRNFESLQTFVASVLESAVFSHDNYTDKLFNKVSKVF